MLIETLEGRRLYSVSTVVSPGALQVNVNGYADVTETAPNTITVSDGAGHSQTFTDILFVTIAGGSGNDEIHFTGGSNDVTVQITGGNGDDSIFVTDTNPAVDATGKNFSTNPILVYGGNGNDRLVVVRGSQTTVYGENGNDTLIVQDGTANLNGGNGNDTASVSGNGTTVTWNGGNGTNVLTGTV